MPDYQAMYLALFNKVSNIIEQLQEAQCECEQIYIETVEE